MWLKQKELATKFARASKRSPSTRVARASRSLPSARLRLAWLALRTRYRTKRTPRRLVVASSSTCFGFKFGFEFEFKFEFKFGLKYGFYKIC